ncbi:hypothetical protein Tco_0941632 [Tanacetum coccineum]|uniref:Uncharacterized protein n=1 Tax=Tanacetum coccineum TaxID=301880 RepID=A0ABQ5DS71_9ASTR
MFVLSAPLLDVLASVVPPTPTTPKPPIIPITTIKAPTSTSVNPESKTLSALQLRVSDLEKEVKELKHTDLSITLRASIRSEVPSAINEYLGSSVGDALQKEPEKQALFDSMHESKSFNKHPANKTLYHTLIESLIADENVMDQGVANLIKHKKRLHDDDDRDQYPPAGRPRVEEKKKASKDADSSKKPKSTGSSKDTTPSQPKSTKKPPLSFDDLMSTPIDFSGFAMNRLKISKLTKVDLVGPVYNLLKGTGKSCVELDYNMEECYCALSDQLDWNNPEGNRCPYDLSKPQPLHESERRKH